MSCIHYKNMFLKRHKIGVNVSEIALYLTCPRKVYYSCHGHEIVPYATVSYIRHLLLKEMGLKIPDLLKTYSSKDDGIMDDLEFMLSEVKDELSFIYPEELADLSSDMLEEAISEARSYLPEMEQNLTLFIEDENTGKLYEQLLSAEPGNLFHSEKLNLSGIPGLVAKTDDTLSPLIVKTGNCPEMGVWSKDRLHITALAILMEESAGTPVRSGIVIYSGQGSIRYVNVRSNDRRQVLQILGRLRKIKDGFLPDRKESPLCGDCAHLEKCKIKSSLASKFF